MIGFATICRLVTVINKGANPINVYPASGGTIDALAANASIQIPANGVMEFWSASATGWYSSVNQHKNLAASNTGVLPIANGGTNSSTGTPTFTGLLASGTTGIGYTTGAGGTVAQATSRTTGVTLNKLTGAITLLSGTTTAGTFSSFTVTNSTVAATDAVIVNFVSGATADSYSLCVTAVAAGSFRIQVHNIAAVAVAEAPVIRFTVIKGISA